MNSAGVFTVASAKGCVGSRAGKMIRIFALFERMENILVPFNYITLGKRVTLTILCRAEITVDARYSVLKAIKSIGFLFTLAVSISACGVGNEKWKEEVQLSDGRIIVVEREMIRAAGGDEWASNSSGSKPMEYRIQFLQPDRSGNAIEWRSTKIDFQMWPEVPLVFDMESGRPIIFSLVAISSGCEVYSKYVYQGGVWIEQPLPEKFEPHTTNLLFGSQKNLPALVNLEEKRKRNADPVFRKPLRQIGPNLKVCG